MAGKLRRYTADKIDVTYELKRCIHAEECVRGLPAVFARDKHPWVQPSNADPDALARVIMRCPTGALHFEPKDGSTAEPIPENNRIIVTPDGPHHVTGDVRLELGDETVQDTRVALCRCGHSGNKPFCDNAHKKSGFKHPGNIAGSNRSETERTGALIIRPSTNGPLLLYGSFELVSADGETVYRGKKAALCRCGNSGKKPFCDGTHKVIRFTTKFKD